VAKRCQVETALVEQTIYERVLPHVPVPQLHYYGTLQEPGEQVRWLFLENARGDTYSAHVPEHRLAAGQWLGRLHTAAQGIAAAATLPRRGPDHYRQHMRSAWAAIHDGLANPDLNRIDRDVLLGILSLYEQLEAGWQQIASLCRILPDTLVHGDFVGRNMCLRPDQQGIAIRVYDWEWAGWGSPVVDLAQTPPGITRFSTDPDVHAYWEAVRAKWPAVDLELLERLGNIGTIFRQLAAIGWVAGALDSEWIRRAVIYLSIYLSRLSRAVAAAGWIA
jgi:aminoglycoside phosphotransferase (APT) family kinase protein